MRTSKTQANWFSQKIGSCINSVKRLRKEWPRSFWVIDLLILLIGTTFLAGLGPIIQSWWLEIVIFLIYILGLWVVFAVDFSSMKKREERRLFWKPWSLILILTCVIGVSGFQLRIERGCSQERNELRSWKTNIHPVAVEWELAFRQNANNPAWLNERASKAFLEGDYDNCLQLYGRLSEIQPDGIWHGNYPYIVLARLAQNQTTDGYARFRADLNEMVMKVNECVKQNKLPYVRSSTKGTMDVLYSIRAPCTTI